MFRALCINLIREKVFRAVEKTILFSVVPFRILHGIISGWYNLASLLEVSIQRHEMDREK